MAGRRGSPVRFGPHWLERRLAQLLPGFPEVSLCVAFSGGADSTALLAALAAVRPRPRQLRALHIDHGLQKASARWSAHCVRVARGLAVPLTVRRARLTPRRGESLEALAREHRYRLLAAALADHEILLTAHHQDDQLETVLLQLLRGCGIAGLAAMPELAPLGRGLLARPLLGVSGAQLRAFAQATGLSWVEDDSNALEQLDRNYLRARVVPLLRARWPGAAGAVGRTARHAGEAQQLLDALGTADADRARTGALLSAAVLRRLPLPRRRNALRAWIAAAGVRPPPATRLEELATALLTARPDAQPSVAWAGARVRRQGEQLSLESEQATTAVPAVATAPFTWHWRDSRTCLLPGQSGTLTLRADAHGPVDLDALAPGLTVRARRGGEALRPVRGGPRRLLKKLLQEARVPPQQRAHLPLLYAGERLIAAGDRWLDESVQAGAGSTHRGRLRWRPGAPKPRPARA